MNTVVDFRCPRLYFFPAIQLISGLSGIRRTMSMLTANSPTHMCEQKGIDGKRWGSRQVLRLKRDRQITAWMSACVKNHGCLLGANDTAVG